MNYLSPTQVETLLRPLKQHRVEHRRQAGQELSYLAQQDVRAHANRIFGFCRWSAEVLSTTLLFEEQNEKTDERSGEIKTRWYVGWQAIVKVTVHAPDGTYLATYTEAAVGGNTQPQRHEAHDMSLKTAVSDAIKRCFTNLGDQYGLSLYNQGSLRPIVQQTLVLPEDWPEDATSNGQPEEESRTEAAANPATPTEPGVDPHLTWTGVSDGASDDEIAKAEDFIKHALAGKKVEDTELPEPVAPPVEASER